MKDRTRESIFNLITTEINGRHVFDLFAGTGALALEALSRGAASATLVEKHVPSARIVEENVHILGVEHRAKLMVTSAFLWVKRDWPTVASSIRQEGGSWLVFCSPPYAFFSERRDDMLDMVRRIQEYAAPGSVLVVEADERFDFEALRGDLNGVGYGEWKVRSYAPAEVGTWRKG